MSLKIDASMSATAYHIVNGAVVFPYAIDAQHAINSHPQEWSSEPWSADDMASARSGAGAPPEELSPEDQAALDEHNRAVAEAAERLKAYREKKEAERQEAEQVKADESIVASSPPRPDPNRPKRPFGRSGEPTPAELEQIKKREAKKADDERIAREKADADAQAAASAKITQ